MLSKFITGTTLFGVASLMKSTEAAVATFSNNGISGTVTASDGTVTVDLDISSLDTSSIGGSSCFADGFSYHIHEKWDHSDNNDKLGGTNCGSTYTGGHWDPWIACGGATGNVYCSTKGGCVTGSSVLSDESDYSGYSCSDFTSNPYVCEVGDWSGKYGKVTGDSATNTIFYASNSNSNEVDGTDLSGLSVVFHCGSDGSRAFCAPFESTSSDSGTGRPAQSSDSQIAKFTSLGDTSAILLENDGNYEITFDISSMNLPSDCGNSLMYRIYNGWTDMNRLSSTGDQKCSDNGIGSFYDPTVTCAPDSDATDFCDNGVLCDDNSYSYSCDVSNARYECAPGDLSGKYGVFDVSSGQTTFNVAGNDELMIDLGLVNGKSAALQCSDTYEVVACAQFRKYDSNNPMCVTSCGSSPCNCGEVTDCNICHTGQGCSQCNPGFWQLSKSQQCEDCADIDNCLHCGNHIGCQQCAQGYFRVYDVDCGLYYCL